jgi:hypothetical protein
VGPERSQLLQILPSLTVRQFFSISAYFCLGQDLQALIFCRRLVFANTNNFVDAYILLMPTFVDTTNFVVAKFFCIRQCFS